MKALDVPEGLASEVDGSPVVTGTWCPVFYVPDPSVGERVAIGVAMTTADGVRLTRVRRDYAPLAAVWGDRVLRDLPFLIEHLTGALQAGRPIEHPNLQLGVMRELWSAEPERSLEPLYRKVCAGRD